jgi:outer membrane protein assembly factor BamB
MKHQKILILFLILMANISNATDIQLKQNWSVSLNGNANTSYPVLFPNESKPTDIIITGPDSNLYRVNATGETVFVYDLGDNSISSPVAGNVVGDDSSEILIATVNGTIHCLESSGKLNWKFETGSTISYSLVLADLDSDDRLEIFASTKSGWLYCINGDGSLRWKFRAEPSIAPPTIGDLNYDTIPEVVFGTDVEKIFCLSNKGQYLWHTEYDGYFGRSLPIISDIDANGKIEILFSRSEVCRNPSTIAFDGLTGKALWEAPTTLHGYGPFAVTDIDHDGELDILVTDKATTVYCFTPQGKRKWVCQLQGRGIFYPPAVADLDGDGELEIISGKRYHGDDYKDVISIIDSKGKILQQLPLKGGGNSCPTIGDLNKDGKLEIYMVTQSPAKLVQFEVENVKKSGKVLWSTWQGNSCRNGLVVNPFISKEKAKPSKWITVSFEKGKDTTVLLGENQVIFPIDPLFKNKLLLLQTKLSSKNGDVTTIDFIKSGAAKAIAKFNVMDIENHRLELTLIDRTSGEKLFGTKQNVQSINFMADLNHLESNFFCIDSIQKNLEGGIESDVELCNLLKLKIKQQKENLRKNLHIFETRITEKRDKFISSVEQKRAYFFRQLQLLKFLSSQRKNGNHTSFACWEDANPWDNEPVVNLYPIEKSKHATVSVIALGNETESRAIYLTNFSSKPLYLKLGSLKWFSVSGEKLDIPGAVELREGIEVGTFKRTTILDALPKLNQGHTITIPALGNRVLWLTFITKGLKPGEYNADLTLYTLGNLYQEQTIKLNLNVSKIALPKKNRLSFYTWARLGSDPKSPLTQQKLLDLINHGTTVFSVSAPVFNYDDNGNLLEEIDWTRHDAWMDNYQNRGIILVPSFQNAVRGTKESPMWSAPWKMAYQQAIIKYSAHLKELGFENENWALYPFDEPWLTGMSVAEQLYEVAKLTKNANPKVQIYTDPAGMPTLENSKKFVGLVDIWMPMIDLLKEDKELLEFYKATGAKVWTYEAPEHSKFLKPLGLYRLQPWLAFRYGLTGCGMWTYNWGNRWAMDKSELETWGMVYEDGENIVTSRRWEAYRDGVEDYNMLTLLREVIEVEKGSPKLRKTAEKLLTNAVNQVTEKQEMAVSNSRFNIEYDPDYSVLMDYRIKIIRMLEKLY